MTGRARLTARDCYITALRRWVPFLWKEPNSLLAGSCWFILTCVPVVTAGPALLALTHYVRARERGERVTWREARSFAFGRCGAKGWLMGLCDAAALILAAGCALTVTEETLPVPVRFLYAVLFAFDVSFLLSGMFRYPALRAQPEDKLGVLILRGYLLALGNLGWTLLIFCAQLLALMVCALTGVGIFLLFPAASACLAACAYDCIIRQYVPDKEDEGVAT